MSWARFRRKITQKPQLVSQNSVDFDSGLSSESDADNCSLDEKDYYGKLLDKMRQRMGKENDVVWSRRYTELPNHKLSPFQKEVVTASTGPGEGAKNIQCVNSNLASKANKKDKKNGYNDQHCMWTKRHPKACGISTSLYDCDPVTHLTSGDPVADVYAVVARPNGCILALADGVNWGEKSKLAAQCAVAGCLQYLNSNLFSSANTLDVLYHLLKGFEMAHSYIIDNQATMTTLCAAVVCQLQGTDKWGLCCVNVGDSLAFVYNKEKGVREVTLGSHFGEGRDMRSPGGSLGPSDGYNPDLGNLTFSFTTVNSGDIVFLTSDGVSDNFDPVVSKCHHCDSHKLKPTSSLDSQLNVISKACVCGVKKNQDLLKVRCDSDPPVYCEWDIPTEKHKKIMADMRQVIEEEGPEDHISATEVCAKLLSHVCCCTEQKRSFLEQVDKDDHSEINKNKQLRRAREREIAKSMRNMPGKLDHAAVVAFEVGPFPLVSSKEETNGHITVVKETEKRGFRDVISGFLSRQLSSSPASSTEMETSCKDKDNKGDNFVELYSLLGV